MTQSIVFDSIEQMAELLETHAEKKGVLITTQSIFALYGNAVLASCPLKLIPVFIPDGEEAKTLEWASHCWEKMIAAGLDRQSFVVALGGGSVGDLAGFVAACYMRGLALIHLPTTLLSMVDSSVGGKNSINIFSHKNLIGTFAKPYLTFIDYNFLKTLPARELSSGIAEIIKYGAIADLKLFEELENNIAQLLKNPLDYVPHVIPQCCQIKKNITEQDLEDKLGMRALLNFGHTFGHAIESLTGFCHYLHGEAVAIGMSCACYLSYQLGLCSDRVFQRMDQLIHMAGLPTALPFVEEDRLIAAMKKDKKSLSGHLNFILIEQIGEVISVSDVSE
ncbi:MAG: 3-dehydroquinate synthase, partial [Parachlamydiales bacterium]|nr:3-dehydroquinate synthase [Parachlamydiales bacterium]